MTRATNSQAHPACTVTSTILRHNFEFFDNHHNLSTLLHHLKNWHIHNVLGGPLMHSFIRCSPHYCSRWFPDFSQGTYVKDLPFPSFTCIVGPNTFPTQPYPMACCRARETLLHLYVFHFEKIHLTLLLNSLLPYLLKQVLRTIRKN